MNLTEGTIGDAMNDIPNKILNEEAVKFLNRDFDQCFQQMRHYDNQILDAVKFALTADSFIVGAGIAFYKYGLDNNVDLRGPGIAMSIIAFLLGLVLFSQVTRNRVYFVLVTRYINEHRGFFLSEKPLGFENKTRMYTNLTQPPYFNWRSSQALLFYVLGILNSGLVGLGVYFIFDSFIYKWHIICLAFFIILIAQLATAIIYLCSRENKSASKAVFGRE